jgi:hypothetical protein
LHRLPAPRIHEKTPGPTFDKRTILVRFRPGTSESEQDQSLEEHGLSRAGEIPRIRFVVARIKGDRSAKGARTEMARDGRVEIAQLNYLRHGFAAPNDPAYAAGDQNYLKNIKMPAAWDITHGSTSHSIAILDTGVDLDHPDLSGSRIKPGYDFVNSDSDPQDDNGHGTMVAGIAAAKTNNSMGVAGAAWAAGIIPVKVLNSTATGTDAQIASGITWASDNGAKVINLSLGGYGESPALENAVDYAVDKGIVVVASAGNDAVDIPTYPAAYDPALAVSATGIGGGQFAWFSNHGWWIDVSAPGMSIVSTYLASGPTESYAIGDGTSFASPIVAGIANLVRYENPSWTPAKVMSQIEKTARDWGPAGIDPYYGWGWVDGNAALGGAKQSPGTAAQDSREPNGTPDRATAVSSSLGSNTISPEGDVDWFVRSVTSTTARSLTFTVTAPPFSGTRPQEFDPVLEVYGSNLKIIAAVDYFYPGTAETAKVPISGPGDYFLMVRNYAGSQSPGSYTVSASTSSKLTAAPFAYAGGADPSTRPSGGLAVADITGDGRGDVLRSVGSSSGPSLQLYPGQLDGGLGEPTDFTATLSSGGGPIATGDFTNDGKTDVALGVTSAVCIFPQTTGTLGVSTCTTLPHSPIGLDAGDINTDGLADLAVTVNSGPGIVLRNTGSDFQAESITGASEMRIADVTGDGNADIVGLQNEGTYSGKIVVSSRQGDGTYTSTTYSVLNFYTTALGVGDVTNDGKTDVLVLGNNLSTATLEVWAQSAGSLANPVQYAASAGERVIVTDLNGDGRRDVLLNTGASARFSTMIQQTDASLLSQGGVGISAPSRTLQAAVGDIDADGAEDVALAVHPDTSGLDDVLEVWKQPTPEALWVRQTSPPDFKTGVSRTVSPSITFRRGLDASSINSSTVYMLNGTSLALVAMTVSYDSSSKKIKLSGTGSRSANKPYIVFVDGVKDTNGNVMPLYTYRFTTGS